MGRIRARAVGGELTLLVHLAPREKLDDTCIMIRAAELADPAVLTHLLRVRSALCLVFHCAFVTLANVSATAKSSLSVQALWDRGHRP